MQTVVENTVENVGFKMITRSSMILRLVIVNSYRKVVLVLFLIIDNYLIYSCIGLSFL